VLGLIGKRYVLDFKARPDVDLVAEIEIPKGRPDEAAATIGGSPHAHGDFRRMLDDPCLGDRYRATFPDLAGRHLARASSSIQAHPPAWPLPARA